MAGELNLDDPAVRQMAESDHRPDEVWTNRGELIGVHCRCCFNRWPCPTTQRLRALEVPDESECGR